MQTQDYVIIGLVALCVILYFITEHFCPKPGKLQWHFIEGQTEKGYQRITVMWPVKNGQMQWSDATALFKAHTGCEKIFVNQYGN